jgi:hypothetical protein
MIRTGFIALIVLVLAFAAAGATLNDYSSRLGRANQIVNTALKAMPGESGWEQKLGSEVQNIIPAAEKIEWPSGEVTTDNKWLAESFDALSKTNKIAEKRTILNAVGERLEALAAVAKELDTAVAGSHSKDEDKRKLADILRRPEYQKAEEKPESLFQRWTREFSEWLDRVFPSAPKMPAVGSGLGGLKVGLQILIFVAVIALVGFLIYKFAPGLLGRFGGAVKESRGDRVILGERVSGDESASDLFSDAERLAREGDLRGAIRKGYIAILCELGDRKVVRLARHKTNRDYLRDVRCRGDLYGNMTGLTGTYERNWYGQAKADDGDWEEFRTGARQAMAAAKGQA